MDPIATYNEARFDGKRTFELFEDKVVVRGTTTFTSDFEVSVPLARIDPDFARLRLRNKNFWMGVWIMVVAWVLASIVGEVTDKAYHVVGILVGIGLVGILIAAATARKVEWVQFKTDGGVVAFDLARAGKEKNRLDSFVETLLAQISIAKDSARGDSALKPSQ
jgi:hypothetical protein